jgi:hypothetical protein
MPAVQHGDAQLRIFFIDLFRAGGGFAPPAVFRLDLGHDHLLTTLSLHITFEPNGSV